MDSIANSTDSGTRRPAEASFSQVGVYFQPLIISPRPMKINPISIINANNPFFL